MMELEKYPHRNGWDTDTKMDPSFGLCIVYTGPGRISILGTHSRPFGQAYGPENRDCDHPFNKLCNKAYLLLLT